MSNNIGTTIAQLRKERNITQEQLATYVNVSPQAVSKWENGGTPDCELLPKIADYFQVSIDNLFGRNIEPELNIKQAMANDIVSFENDKRFKEVMEYLWTLQCALTDDTSLHLSYKQQIDLRKNVKSYSQMLFDDGISLMSLNEKLQYFMCIPEPDDGWLKHLATIEQYNKRFALLAEKDTLESIIILYSIKPDLFTAQLIKSKLHLSDDRTNEIISLLIKNKIATEVSIQTENGSEKVYRFIPNPAFIGILILAMELIDPPKCFSNYNNSRSLRNYLQAKENK